MRTTMLLMRITTLKSASLPVRAIRHFATATTLIAFTILNVACDGSPSAITAPEVERIRLAVDQNQKDFGAHAVHVNALTTDQLTPTVAKAYGIVRSDSVVMLNVVIIENDGSADGQPAAGNVEVNAVNLTGQLKSVDIRKVQEGENIYYIGELSIDNQETLIFNIDVQPEGAKSPYLMAYSRKFYTD
jgi:hypothetical protein